MSLLTRTPSRTIRRSLTSQCRTYSAPTDGSIPVAKQRFVPDSGVYPKGFIVGSAHAGVKASNKTKDDVAIVASEKLCRAAGYFTKNAFRAAPVTFSQKVFSSNRGGNIRGIVINSGCANAVTGTEGYADAVSMSEAVDNEFQAETRSELSEVERVPENALARDDTGNSTIVMSTGVIGQR